MSRSDRASERGSDPSSVAPRAILLQWRHERSFSDGATSDPSPVAPRAIFPPWCHERSFSCGATSDPSLVAPRPLPRRWRERARAPRPRAPPRPRGARAPPRRPRAARRGASPRLTRSVGDEPSAASSGARARAAGAAQGTKPPCDPSLAQGNCRARSKTRSCGARRARCARAVAPLKGRAKRPFSRSGNR